MVPVKSEVMYKISVSKFNFLSPHPTWVVRDLGFYPPLKKNKCLNFFTSLLIAVKSDLIFFSNPLFIEMFVLFLVKLIKPSAKVVVFDLILKPPRRKLDWFAITLKKWLLRRTDYFLCIHKDLSGYSKFYGVNPAKSLYIPFKANNFDIAHKIETRDGDYVVALGASQRDYRLLIDAMKRLPYPLKIIMSKKSASEHNAQIPETLPSNVEHVDWFVDKEQWSKYIAESRCVVVPILADAIQPAGISVYLEAMILGKAVIVTEGASANDILTPEVAITVPANNADALCAAIDTLWLDDVLRSRLGLAGKDYASALGSHARLAADVEDALEAIVQKRPAC